MRLLVLGGTVFLSRAVAEEAVARGHEVTCAARGRSGGVPDGARLVVLDRASDDPASLDGSWDAVVDVARTPSWVRRAVEGLADRVPHWTFVSSISVYADHGRPGTGRAEDLPLLPAELDDLPQDSAEAYGSAKVGCEQLVVGGTQSAHVVRPGLIVGPGDPTGRFSWWPERLAEPGEALAPAPPGTLVQVIDVRDLAAWIVTAAERGLTGAHDATGRPLPFARLVAEVGAGVGGAPEPTWVDPAFLVEQDVAPWTGPRSLPLWLPAQDAPMLAHDVSAAYAAGLATRPLAETARDTLAWLRAHPDAPRTGLTRAEERAVLDAWHAR